MHVHTDTPAHTSVLQQQGWRAAFRICTAKTEGTERPSTHSPSSETGRQEDKYTGILHRAGATEKQSSQSGDESSLLPSATAVPRKISPPVSLQRYREAVAVSCYKSNRFRAKAAQWVSTRCSPIPTSCDFWRGRDACLHD